MSKQLKVYIDGRWLPASQAKVSVFDHGFLYGDGVFEGIRAYDGFPFRLREHLARLKRSADLIEIKLPKSLAAIGKIVTAAVRKNGLRDAYIRLIVSRGPGDLGLDPRSSSGPSLIVIVDRLRLFPAEFYEKGLPAIVAKRRRTNPDALDPSIKSMNYLNNILAKVEASKAGVPEAIMLNSDGYVSECTGDNVFYVKGNTIVTPPVSAGVLVGITRASVIEVIWTKTRYRLVEKLFRPEALYGADEVFFTGTAAEVIPVTRIDGRRIGTGRPGEITAELTGHFRDLIRREAKSRR